MQLKKALREMQTLRVWWP